MLKWRKAKPNLGLVFDIENKPGTFGPGDYTHPKLTAIGCMYLGRRRAKAWTFKRDDTVAMRAGAEAFRAMWDGADFVVAHNGRRHDVKILDGFYTMLDLPLLSRKKLVDTYLDQPKMAGLSRSLENLAERWASPIKKLHLSEYDWERAWDGDPAGIDLMRKRVSSDVLINAWLYEELVRRGLLKWT